MNKDPDERALVSGLIEDPWLTRESKHPLDIFTAGDTDSEGKHKNESEDEDSSSEEEGIGNLVNAKNIVKFCPKLLNRL